MARAAKICSHVDRNGSCPNVVPCPVHARKPWEGSTRRSELPPDWERRRRSVLARDELCTLRIVCDGAIATEVHHLGDKHDHRLDRLAGTCSDCHKIATSRQAAEARREGR